MSISPRVVHIREPQREGIERKYIGRGSPYGNPWKIGLHGNRQEVIKMFKFETLPTISLDLLEALRGFDLACYCAPLACHGDVLWAALYESEGGDVE